MYHLSNTAVPLIGSACYLGLIKGLHTLMKDKKPVAVPKMVLLLYNLIQARARRGAPRAHTSGRADIGSR